MSIIAEPVVSYFLCRRLLWCRRVWRALGVKATSRTRGFQDSCETPRSERSGSMVVVVAAFVLLGCEFVGTLVYTVVLRYNTVNRKTDV